MLLPPVAALSPLSRGCNRCLKELKDDLTEGQRRNARGSPVAIGRCGRSGAPSKGLCDLGETEKSKEMQIDIAIVTVS